MSFSLSIPGGASGTFAELGVTAASLEVSNQGHDVLSLTLGRNLASADLFPAFALATLAQNGSTVFTGWVDQAPAVATG